MSAMIEKVRQLDVRAASGIWTQVESGARTKTIYFARSSDGRWWSEAGHRGVLLFDGQNWWKGQNRFALERIRIEGDVQVKGGRGVHHDGLLQNMLAPAGMNIWGDSSNPFNSHRPVECIEVSPGLMQIDFAPTVADKPQLAVRADLGRGCIMELRAADTTAAFASLVIGEPPDWIFLSEGAGQLRTPP